MNSKIDKKYRSEQLLDWELQSLIGKYAEFSFYRESTWRTLGFTIFVCLLFAFFIPFIPPRYSWNKWNSPKTIEEYGFTVLKFLIAVPIMITAVFAYINIRNKIDLGLGVKRIGNFKIISVLNFASITILVLNGWRIFILKKEHRSLNSVKSGQIITIKRTGTYRLIDHYIRSEKAFNDEQWS